MATSTAYVLLKDAGYKYTFDGVTSISHALTLKVSTEPDGDENADYVNHAKNEPDVLTLSVVASDAHVPVIGWSRQVLTSLCQIKEHRLLCKVFTSLRVYDNMLLTSLSVQQDDSCPDGWTGTLTFTHVNPPAAAYTDGYSSSPVSTGASAAKSLGRQDGSVMTTILREAGIR